MAILTHGSDLRLAPTIRPLVQAGDGTVRGAIRSLRESGFSAIQLDATMTGIRPRELSKRARQDLSALLIRHDMQLAGLDFFIPLKHFTEAEYVDQAIARAAASIELAADLGRLPLSMALPIDQIGRDVIGALIESADAHGIKLAIHAEDQIEELAQWLSELGQPAVGAGVDPAALLARKLNPVSVVHENSKQISVARLSDLTDSALRCAVGQGSLDVGGYRISLDLAVARTGPVVLDLRGLESPVVASAQGAKAWESQAFSI
jgi:sugar phosphate isomerase/epimerase